MGVHVHFHLHIRPPHRRVEAVVLSSTNGSTPRTSITHSAAETLKASTLPGGQAEVTELSGKQPQAMPAHTRAAPISTQSRQDPQVDPISSVSPSPFAPSSPRTHRRSTSLTLPILDDAKDLNPLFPSPSSAFHPPPPNEAETINDLLSRNQTRRQSDSTNLKGPLSPADPTENERSNRRRERKRSNSLSNVDSTAGGTKEASSPTGNRGPVSQSTTPAVVLSSGEGTPMTASTSAASASSGVRSSSRSRSDSRTGSRRTSQPPSRPMSTYRPYLASTSSSSDDEVSARNATPSNEVARRLSASTHRRDSEGALQVLLNTTSPILIRDFAFPSADPRHIGAGRILSRRTSVGVSASDYLISSGQQSASIEQVFEEDGERTGTSSSAYTWGFVTSHAEGEGYEAESDGDGLVEQWAIPEEGALFVAAYAFEPEANQEMRLDEGEVIRVWERYVVSLIWCYL